MAETPTKKASPLPSKARGWDRPHEDIVGLVRKAEAGDPAALAEFREMLTRPGSAEALGGNIAREALRSLVATSCGGNPAVVASTEQKFAEMRTELLGPTPTPLERLLVERVIATWFQVGQLEAQYGRKTDLSLTLGLYYQKCISAAHKRYLSAVKALADIRRLALPALQVNIARKQVNVAAGAAVN